MPVATPDRKLVLCIAGTYQQSEYLRNKREYSPREWDYISDITKLFGAHPNTYELVLFGNWYDRKDYLEVKQECNRWEIMLGGKVQHAIE